MGWQEVRGMQYLPELPWKRWKEELGLEHLMGGSADAESCKALLINETSIQLLNGKITSV